MGNCPAVNKKFEMRAGERVQNEAQHPVNPVNFIAPWYTEAILIQFLRYNFGNRHASHGGIVVFGTPLGVLRSIFEHPAVLVLQCD